MKFDPSRPTESDDSFAPRRLYLHEPGWRIGLKGGSEREFCYMMAPGQDFYHRLFDGEIFLYRPEERICLACAVRRGLISYEPKGLREPLDSLVFDIEPSASGFELRAMDDVDWAVD